MPEQTNEIWNSLEIAKLVVSMLTPVLIVGLTIWVNARMNKLDQRLKKNESISQKKVDLYDEVGIKANKLFAYVQYVGTWKETSPREILNLKRELDTVMHTYKPWFSEEFTEKYRAFILSIFSEYQGHGKDAKIITTLQDREEFYPETWDKKWDDLISNEINEDASQKYSELLEGISKELGLQEQESQSA